MSVPQDCKYTKEHEWAKPETKKVRVGITDYAQKELGDVVFVEVPEVGRQVTQGQSFASVESVKAVSDIYAPIDGTVVEVNAELSSSPELINQSPHENGWIALIEPKSEKQLETLLSPDQYAKHLEAISK